jgi:zinc/manganese transport system substrate-binding protein
MRRRVALPAALASSATLCLAGCGGVGTTTASPAKVSVVATTTILGDVAGMVATCGGASLHVLMPVGADPHDFSPSSADITEMVTADLVIANGLGLEEGLSSALATAQADGARVLEVAPELDPIPFSAQESPQDEHTDGASSTEDAHGGGSLDPHVWLDVSRMARAATLIGNELAEVTGDDAFSDCGEQVASDLDATDEEVRAVLDKVPDGSRILVTDHEAFGYFAEAYDFEIAGVVVPGGSTLAEPSSAELEDLVGTIRSTGVKAVFANTASPTALIDAVAAESGARIAVVELYVGSLGPAGSGAETYQQMMLTNASRIADGLTD